MDVHVVHPWTKAFVQVHFTTDELRPSSGSDFFKWNLESVSILDMTGEGGKGKGHHDRSRYRGSQQLMCRVGSGDGTSLLRTFPRTQVVCAWRP